jgi:hypothetical protein
MCASGSFGVGANALALGSSRFLKQPPVRYRRWVGAQVKCFAVVGEEQPRYDTSIVDDCDRCAGDGCL